MLLLYITIYYARIVIRELGGLLFHEHEIINFFQLEYFWGAAILIENQIYIYRNYL